MLVLLITAFLGTAFAIFATQNTQTVDINFGKYFIQSIPLYLVVLVPLLLGLLLAYILHLMNTLSHDLTIDEQKQELRKLKSDLAEMTKKSHKLELENIKMKKKNGDFDEDSME